MFYYLELIFWQKDKCNIASSKSIFDKVWSVFTGFFESYLGLPVN
jgi:hypothetical protein